MNNIDFVERFIAGTKEKQLQWSEFNGSMNGCLYDKRNDNAIIIGWGRALCLRDERLFI